MASQTNEAALETHIENTPAKDGYLISNPAECVIDVQIADNTVSQNRQLPLEKLIQNAINIERKRALDLYPRYAPAPGFKQAIDATIARA